MVKKEHLNVNVWMVVIALLSVMAVGGLVYASDEVVTLTVLNYLDLTNPNSTRDLEEIWGAFEKANPNIIIEREDLYLEPFHQKTAAYAAANLLPDVVYMWPGGRSGALHSNRLVKDLRPLLGDEAAQFSEAALVNQAGGYLAMLPIGITTTHVLYANTKLLNELGLSIPETYEELKAMVPVLKAAGKDVILMGAQDDWVVQSTLFSMIVGRLAGDEFIDDILAGHAKFTDEPFIKSLEFYQSLFQDGILTTRSLQTPYNDVNALWAEGQAPFMIDGDWKVGNFLTDATTGEALIPPAEQQHIVMTIFPAIPGEINSGTSSVVVGVGFGMSSAIPDGSAKEAAAWKLISWLNSPEVQKLRLETGGSFPSRIGVTSDKLEPFAQERARFYGTHTGTYVLDSVFEGAVYGPLNIGLQEIGLGFSTPRQVANIVQQAFDNWKATQ